MEYHNPPAELGILGPLYPWGLIPSPTPYQIRSGFDLELMGAWNRHEETSIEISKEVEGIPLI